jgi:DNA processing protein
MQNNDFYTLLVSLLPGVGASRYWSWMAVHNSPYAILTADPYQLPKLSPEAQQLLLTFQQQGENSPLASRAYQVLDNLEQQRGILLTHHHSHYPALLREIHRPPPLLYARGNTDLLGLPQLAIVGTRHPTPTGIDNTRAFARYLAQGGFTITSGLALGVDGIAHESALSAGGNTIAVMGTGIDHIYPQRHRHLAAQLLDQGGLLLSEFTPGTKAHAAHFPQRNRLISGLSMGVLVVEAALKSGSLITARYALEQNRDVFAIPGSIHNPQAKGCHALIKQGAQLVETADDIVSQLGGLMHQFTLPTMDLQSTPKSKLLNTQEQQVLAQIGHDRVVVDQLIARTGLSSHEISATLVMLEIKGAIKQSDWGYEAIHDTV